MSSLSQTARVCQSYMDAGIVPFIKGPPGVGKSSMIYQLAVLMGLDPRPHHEGGQVIEFRPCLHDPVDLMGLPAETPDGGMQYLTPSWLPRDGEGILFIDELPQATPAMQSALSQLLLDRRIGEYTLPDGWKLISAGNRESDRAATFRMPTQVSNRLGHLEIEFSLDDFVKWCIDEDQPEELIAFAKYRPGVFDSFDANKAVNCTPRSAVKAATQINIPDKAVRNDAILGLMGDAGSEFIGFIEIWQDLPADIKEITDDPKGFKVPDDDRLDIAFATSQWLVTKTDKSNLKEVMTYIDRLPAETGVTFMKELTIRHPEFTIDPTLAPIITDWFVANNAIL